MCLPRVRAHRLQTGSRGEIEHCGRLNSLTGNCPPNRQPRASVSDIQTPRTNVTEISCLQTAIEAFGHASLEGKHRDVRRFGFPQARLISRLRNLFCQPSQSLTTRTACLVKLDCYRAIVTQVSRPAHFL